MSFFDKIVGELTNISTLLDPILKMKAKEKSGVTQPDILSKAGTKGDMSQIIFELSKLLLSTKAVLESCGSHIEKLQAKVISATENLLEETHVLQTISDKDGAISKLTEENEEIKKQLTKSSTTTERGDKVQTVPDWSNIDFTQSITKAVTKAVRVEKSKDRKIAEKSNNIMLFGVDTTKRTTAQILNEVDVSEDDVIACVKLPKKNNDGELSAFRVTLAHPAMVARTLRAAGTLKYSGDGFDKVYITPDRTPEQQIAHKHLVQKLKSKIEKYPKRRWIISRGDIVDVGEFKQDDE